MIVLIFLGVVIFSIHGFSKYKNETFVIFLFFSALLIFFSGFRYKFGADYENYLALYQYDTIPPYPEILYFSISYYMSNIMNIDFVFFIFITALISISLKCYFIYKYANNYVFALLVYCAILYSIYDVGFIRQSLSIGILGLGFHAAFNNCRKKAIFFYVLACLFHFTAIIIFPIHFQAKKFGIKKKPIVLILIIFFFIGNYIIPDIIFYMANLIPNEYILFKVKFYLENYSGTGFSLNAIRTILVCFFLNRTKNSLFKSYYYWGSIVFMLFSFNVQFAVRFYSYVLLLEPVLVANEIS
ncbi:MAG: EpsG family protein [bacterium]|nr:EpsG family protein [bacterium]